MKLYRIKGRHWAGTQQMARELARDTYDSAPWEQVDVPTDKEGMLDWLNQVNAPATSAERCDMQNEIGREAIESYVAGEWSGPRPLAAAAPAPAVASQPVSPAPASDTAGSKAIAAGVDAVADWILDQANCSQVERLFACLGTRFAELRRRAVL
jgi:hypothetical protein